MKKILLVDEAPEARSTYAELLSQEGYHVLTASTPEEVGASILRDRPDLILLDEIGPGGLGREVALGLSVAGETRDIPVVMLSRLSEAEPQDDPKAVPGIRRVIYKPCRPKTFHEGIAHVLRYGR